jgi:hypothetical protein
MFELRTMHLSQDSMRRASACEPPCGVKLWMVSVSTTTPLLESIPTSDRVDVDAFMSLLFVPSMIVDARSSPSSVTLLFEAK